MQNLHYTVSFDVEYEGWACRVTYDGRHNEFEVAPAPPSESRYQSLITWLEDSYVFKLERVRP